MAKHHTSVDHHLATSGLKARPHGSFWAFGDSHWVFRDVFSSRSKATIFINHLVCKYSKFLPNLNGLLTCSDLLKTFRSAALRDVQRTTQRLCRGRRGQLFQLFQGCSAPVLMGPPHHPLQVFLKIHGYWLGCSLNAVCFFCITIIVWSMCYLLLPTNLLNSSSRLKSLAVNSYLYCLRKIWNLYSKIRNAIICMFTKPICIFWRLFIYKFPSLIILTQKGSFLPKYHNCFHFIIQICLL